MIDRAYNMHRFQRFLGEAQAFPILGPAIASPVKAGVGLVEVVGGIAGAVIFGSCATVVGFCGGSNEWLSNRTIESGLYVGMGAASTVYGLSNMITLGITGYVVEKRGREGVW